VARILLIDDDRAFSGFLLAALTEDGHRVDHLESATGAPEILSQGDYDLVLLDNRMPPDLRALSFWRRWKGAESAFRSC
jgi:DNA-binding response OmpR family regulator